MNILGKNDPMEAIRSDCNKEAITMKPSYCERPEVGQISWLDEEIAEVSLLLPGWQAAQLAALATRQRLTVGQLLRNLIKDLPRQEESQEQASRIWSPDSLIFEEGYSNDHQTESSPRGVNGV
jgi:hypothetical protein